MTTRKSNLGLQHGNGSRFKLAAVGYDTTEGEMVQPGKEWLCIAQRSWDAAAQCGISVCFHAIVSQVSLAETAVDKVTCTAMLGHPTVR